MRIEKFLAASPLFHLYVAFDTVLGDFQKRLRAENVHFLQSLILTSLFFEEAPVRPSQFAKAFTSSRSNISHALRSLEKQGLIERAISPRDARAYLFTLTRDGKKKAQRLIKLIDFTENEIEKSMGGKKLVAHLGQFTDSYRGLTQRA